MATEEKQVNILYHKLGHQLLDKGIWFSRNAYKLNPIVFTRFQILTFLNQQTGIPINNLSLADNRFYVESWGKWGQIIDFDLLDQQKYLDDTRDCDNYALMFTARASLIYGLNSAPTAFGNVLDAKTGNFITRHGFNLIIAHDNGLLKLYLYEPQTDDSVLWSKDTTYNTLQNLNWIYRPDWILMF